MRTKLYCFLYLAVVLGLYGLPVSVWAAPSPSAPSTPTAIPPETDKEKTAVIDDAQLREYYDTLQALERVRKKMRNAYKDIFAAQAKVLKPGRFKQILEAQGKKNDLRALHVNKKEEEAFDEVKAAIEKLTKRYKKVCTNCVSEEMGVRRYNTTAHAIAADPALKKRYQALQSKLDEAQKEKKNRKEKKTKTTSLNSIQKTQKKKA